VLLVQSPGLWHLILRTRDPFFTQPSQAWPACEAPHILTL
jgi:hypothetical protein